MVSVGELGVQPPPHFLQTSDFSSLYYVIYCYMCSQHFLFGSAMPGGFLDVFILIVIFGDYFCILYNSL